MIMQRNILFIALLVVTFLIWQAWRADQVPSLRTINQTEQEETPSNGQRLKMGQSGR